MIRLALAQINPLVGDIPGNVRLIGDYMARAARMGADVVAFPELALCGYPPEDLLVKKSFIKNCAEALASLAAITPKDLTVIVGAPTGKPGALYNSACALSGGEWIATIHKTELPNYGVFDERRYFLPGKNGPLVKRGSVAIGVSVCEDIWVENDILINQARDGADLLINISGSPYRHNAFNLRRDLVRGASRSLGMPMAYCNQTGGQDELVFDGRSFICGSDGEITAEAMAFAEDLLVVDVGPVAPGEAAKPPLPPVERHIIRDEDEEIYTALATGLRDYVNKNGFKTVVVALSGGIDSALTATIAVDALGPGRVKGVSLPSPHSSKGSVDDAAHLAANLGIEMLSLPIGELMKSFDGVLAEAFTGREPDITEENIQARIRGGIMMALSNKFGWLVLTTGNKSETAVGYCTLYGDTAGGLAVIKDVFKTRVYSLSLWRNRKAGRELIPRESIEKEPSAELRPGQKDTDSLPPYDVLDPILREYIEHDKPIDEIIKLGYSKTLVSRVARMVDLNEYKRRQSPMGIKITAKAFGRDRRLPITCRFHEQ
ncbi:MAG: NAD+ synthase [Nitrospinae bacterium]|nr:NAD+ synthase [Nitrospinota bacterium]